MPFNPELQARIDALRAPKGDDRASELRRKIAAREGNSGFSANVAALKQALEEETGGNDQS